MTRKKLKQIYHLKRELELWSRRRADIHIDAISSSVRLDGMPYSKTNRISKPVEDAAIKISGKLARIDRQIAKHIKKLNATVSEVEAYILTIEDPELRIIIECRCVQLMSWRQVAKKLGAGYTEESARQKYHRFILTLPPS